jgi:hypothetical protein
MPKQLLVSSALHQIGKDQIRYETEHQRKFDTFSIKCGFRKMFLYSAHKPPAPSCEDKKDPHDWGCSLDGCPYVRKARGDFTGREGDY